MDNGVLINFNKEDLRVQKTYKALYSALFAMLRQRNFNGITVNDLCAEAFISRATFYTHFRDKYDLLRCLLSEIRSVIIKDIHKYDELETNVNQFVDTNKKIIYNILKNANGETLMLVREFMASIVKLTVKRRVSDENSPYHIIFFNFSVGGLVNLLTWLVENDFPPEVTMVSQYLYKMLDILTTWDARQE